MTSGNNIGDVVVLESNAAIFKTFQELVQHHFDGKLKTIHHKTPDEILAYVSSSKSEDSLLFFISTHMKGDPDYLIRVYQAIESAGMMDRAYFMYAYPGEDVQTLLRKNPEKTIEKYYAVKNLASIIGERITHSCDTIH